MDNNEVAAFPMIRLQTFSFQSQAKDSLFESRLEIEIEIEIETEIIERRREEKRERERGIQVEE